MVSKNTTIINKTGLHARPASTFIQAAGKFDSNLTIKNLKNGRQANAKSIVMLLTLALNQGTEIELTAEGPDEKEAVNTLVELIEGGFGEL